MQSAVAEKSEGSVRKAARRGGISIAAMADSWRVISEDNGLCM